MAETGDRTAGAKKLRQAGMEVIPLSGRQNRTDARFFAFFGDFCNFYFTPCLLSAIILRIIETYRK